MTPYGKGTVVVCCRSPIFHVVAGGLATRTECGRVVTWSSWWCPQSKEMRARRICRMCRGALIK